MPRLPAFCGAEPRPFRQPGLLALRGRTGPALQAPLGPLGPCAHLHLDGVRGPAPRHSLKASLPRHNAPLPGKRRPRAAALEQPNGNAHWSAQGPRAGCLDPGPLRCLSGPPGPARSRAARAPCARDVPLEPAAPSSLEQEDSCASLAVAADGTQAQDGPRQGPQASGLLWPPARAPAAEPDAWPSASPPGEQAASRSSGSTGPSGQAAGTVGPAGTNRGRNSSSSAASESVLMVRRPGAEGWRPRQRIVPTPKRRPPRRLPRNMLEDLWQHLVEQWQVQQQISKQQRQRGGAPAPPGSSPRWFIQTQRPRSLSRNTAAAAAAQGASIPLCTVCSGEGRVPCEKCCGRGRTNCSSHAVLPKGVFPKWCWFCRASGLMYCARCLGTGERRGVIGFHVLERDSS